MAKSCLMHSASLSALEASFLPTTSSSSGESFIGFVSPPPGIVKVGI